MPTLPMSEAELLAALHHQAPDAMIFAGTDGTIEAWNDAATRIFGHTREEAMGQSLDLIIPERFRDQHWTAYDKALQAGDTKYRGKVLPTRSMTRDGATIYVELTFAIVKNATGTVIGALAHARDITERFLRERQQQQQQQQ